MASRLVAAAAAAVTSSSPSPLARRISRRGLADHSGHCWQEKVNMWEDPMSPMRRKQSHFTITTYIVWGCFVYGGFKLFGEEENKTKALSAKSKAKAK
ncbi:hypothetical protein C2845_PM07G38210 [Panicum miliaceum]|uniref:Uncharacterized protein n=1 Tax=Panicum miliaceum TaxID=4540 RepID=A0A3L6SSC1_PANMI|nr:hypothetical protein C2845_PM07G38210 [Panicum miliaceum]